MTLPRLRRVYRLTWTEVRDWPGCDRTEHVRTRHYQSHEAAIDMMNRVLAGRDEEPCWDGGGLPAIPPADPETVKLEASFPVVFPSDPLTRIRQLAREVVGELKDQSRARADRRGTMAHAPDD